MLTVDRKITPEELKETKATPFYEKTGLEILREEADKMKKIYGIETYDMNEGYWFRDTKKMFLLTLSTLPLKVIKLSQIIYSNL